MIDLTVLCEELVEEKGGKMLLVVLDGVGDVPDAGTGKTPLEAARTPNLDALAPKASMGLSHPVGRGITPGSGPGHMALFGYDPVATRIGRGVLEALGVGMEMGPNDLAFRANFASKDEAGDITDRRAGRIPTEKNRELVSKLEKELGEVEGCEVILHSGLEHRFVVMLRREGLSDDLTETDPQATGVPPHRARALSPEADAAAICANAFVSRVDEILKDESPANTCLLRGPAKFPKLRPYAERFKLKAAAIAAYPMYRGLAQLVGMEVLDAGATLEDEFACLEASCTSKDFDFVFLHVKKTDSYGEDGNYEKKVHEIERFDSLLPRAVALGPDVMVMTSDHSTPWAMKAHSFHPAPLMLVAGRCFPGLLPRFTERNCAKGVLGHFPALEVVPMMLGHAGRLAKFGA